MSNAGSIPTTHTTSLDHKMHEKMSHHLAQSELNTPASKEAKDKSGDAGDNQGDDIFNNVFSALQHLNDAVQDGVQQDGNLLNAEQTSISAQEDAISALNAQYKIFVKSDNNKMNADGSDATEQEDQSFNTGLESNVMEIQSVQNCESSDISSRQQIIESKGSAVQQNQSEEADMVRQVQQTMMSIVSA